jgi:hypothetical protein
MGSTVRMMASRSSSVLAILLEDGAHALFESSAVPEFVEEKFSFEFESFQFVFHVSNGTRDE